VGQGARCCARPSFGIGHAIAQGVSLHSAGFGPRLNAPLTAPSLLFANYISLLANHKRETPIPMTPTPADINLVVATPCFGGQISVHYAASLFKLQKQLRSYKGINLKILFKDGDALITRARASLISQFLDDSSATHLLFVDADIGFEPEQVLRLIECGADMCAAIYPIKRIDWDKVKSSIETARPNPAAASLRYVFEVDDPKAVIEKSGFVRVRYAGTGFLMIRRGAIEQMCARYPQLQYKSDHSVDAATASDNRFALFECMIAEDGTYLSEDFAFCKRWIDTGGEIWADLNSRLNHVGQMTFCGDLSSQFASAAA
jgi:hypothetical protein